MTEIPEHLLRRAQEAKDRALAKKSAEIPEHLKAVVEKHSVGMGHSGMKAMKVTKVAKPTAPITFSMIRRNDETGISGNGRVLVGVLFPSGKVVVEWQSEKSSIVFWESLEDFLDIHINSHPDNRSLLIWADGTTWEHDPEKG